MKSIGQLRVATFDAGDGVGVLLASEIVGAGLVVDGRVVISHLVVVKALVATDAEARESAKGGTVFFSAVNFVWDEASCSI